MSANIVFWKSLCLMKFIYNNYESRKIEEHLMDKDLNDFIKEYGDSYNIY